MSSDRARAIIDALTADVRRQLVYLALHPARVVSQNTDLTLELKPDAAVLPGLSKVPIRHGLPGVKVKVAAGTRVLLAFEGGDPSRPVATLWDAESVEEIVFAHGSKSIARVDDTVEVTLAGVDVLSLGLLCATPGSPLVQAPTPLSVTLTGKITSGAAKLKG